MEIEKQIKAYAKEIGIHLIGFTSAEPFEELRERIMMRKEKGYLSGFEENDIEKRINPLLTMEDARTIISVGISYYVPEDTLENIEWKHFGELARTAWGRDYHEVVKEKLEQLMQFMESIVGPFGYRLFVDTGPLADREIAYRAGLGWFGKNNLLITEEYGSWVFLGYALTNLDLQLDKPLEKDCGECNRCIQACPTKALEKGFQMNAKICLSYITQTKEEIPEDFRHKMGNRLYGCDTCQRACPYNQRVAATGHEDFRPKEVSHKPDLTRLLAMTKKEFKESYGTTAAGWRGKNYLKRNALIAIGNGKNPKLLPEAAKALKDESEMIRKYAVWAIHHIGGELARNLLEEQLSTEKVPELIELIKTYLEGE